jgi:hypothetical protein
LQCGRRLTPLVQNRADTAIWVARICIEQDGFLEGGDSAVQIFLVVKCDTEIVIRVGKSWVEADGFPESGDGPVKLLIVVEGDSEIVVC